LDRADSAVRFTIQFGVEPSHVSENLDQKISNRKNLEVTFTKPILPWPTDP
jgi:hypothetical protein